MKRLRFSVFVGIAILLGTLVVGMSRQSGQPIAARVAVADVPDSVRRLLQPPFVFVTRYQYAGDHHNTATFFPAALHEHNDGRFKAGSQLKIIHFDTKEVITLLETAEGVIRDPEVHFDARKILFSMRKNLDDSYHIYEINTDGTQLRQLTFMKDVDDLDPFYLADDHIAFSSTREPKYCMCNRHIMANMYRMEPDGSNIYQISKNPLFDGHGSLMPDGRILYDRWEYVDRNYGDAQSLWTSNPDGTNHVLYWGNNTPSPGAVIDARVIPGSNQAVCVFSSCHDRPWGAIAVIDRRIGMDGPQPVVHIWPDNARQYLWESDHPFDDQSLYFDNMSRLQQKFEDPFPLSEQYFICSGQVKQGNDRMGLYLLDTQGNNRLLYEENTLGCYDPVPLVVRQRPPVIPVRRNFTDSVGYFYVQDVYQGTQMEGVQRGEAKYIRIVETPEKRFWAPQKWGGQGSELPAMNWDDFNNKRILGTVPVNDDGSAYFEAPAEKFVYFQLLDKDGQMIQSMRSGTMVQPGEKNGCIGCHENRGVAPSWQKHHGATSALLGNPVKPKPRQGKTEEFSYVKEVQPVFDRYCVQCHQPAKKAGKTLNLQGDAALVFNPSYSELWVKGYIKPVGGGPAQNISARGWGSSASKLITVLRKKHAGITLDSASMEAITTWIDLNAPYYPSYATSYPDHPYGRSPLSFDETEQLKKMTGINIAPAIYDRSVRYYFGQMKSIPERDQAMLFAASSINFVRPEESPALQELKLKNAAKYQEALSIIAKGQERIKINGMNDIAGFTACATDQWREQKYRERRAVEQKNRQHILELTKRRDQ
ncbi:MAG: hypothetical protein LBU62_02175 [Bacteroidales bacterium]|jgi:hypothetical protein|nr:hypothetical protein [Bacteroidales bacterium]